jgi:hypothetical protein
MPTGNGFLRQNDRLTDEVKTGTYRAAECCEFFMGGTPMLKKVFLATAATVILAGASMSTVPAQAGMMNMSLLDCAKKAKAKHPTDRKARKACRKSCKAKKDGILSGLRKS